MVAIFLVGLTLRVHNLGKFPERNRTADEYAWTWSGMTLLSEGTPRAWSWLPGYGGTPVVKWRDNDYRIVKPWLDHPPLYGLYVGAFLHATGTHDIFAVELATMRASTMLLFAATFLLLFAVARRVGDETIALCALAFYAVAPTAVWNGRLVMAEQMITPVALAGWWALLCFVETRRRRWLVAVAVAVALLPLVKVAALSFALFVFTIAVLRRERALVVAVCIGGACGLLLYAGYGAHFGWTLFREIMREQASRFANFGGFYALVFDPRVVEKSFNYLPFLLGFFALLADLRDGRHGEMGLFAVVYAAGIAFFLPYNMYGWYLIPLYPAMAFGLASFVVRAYRDAAAGAVWVWLLFSATYLAWIASDAELVQPRWFRYVYLALFVALPLATVATAKTPRRWRIGFATLVAAQWLGDAWYALRK
ncbi:MAG: glycosyl transferase family 39 [bacterium]|nr:glycosyl transferase family 39 [bacterium]